MQKFVVTLSVLLVLNIMLMVQAKPDTFYPYYFSKEKIENPAIKRIILVNDILVKPQRQALKNNQILFQQIYDYLTLHGYKVINQGVFNQILTSKVEQWGHPFDSSNGQNDLRKKEKIIQSILTDPRIQQQADAVLLFSTLEKSIAFKPGNKMIFYWNGVYRRLKIIGNRGIPKEHRWPALIRTASLNAILYKIKTKQLVFHSLGGIDLSQSIDSRKDRPRIISNKGLLEDKRKNKEAITLALYPFIKNKKLNH